MRIRDENDSNIQAANIYASSSYCDRNRKAENQAEICLTCNYTLDIF